MVSKEAAPDSGGTATRDPTLADLPTREYICAITSISVTRATAADTTTKKATSVITVIIDKKAITVTRPIISIKAIIGARVISVTGATTSIKAIIGITGIKVIIGITGPTMGRMQEIMVMRTVRLWMNLRKVRSTLFPLKFTIKRILNPGFSMARAMNSGRWASFRLFPNILED